MCLISWTLRSGTEQQCLGGGSGKTDRGKGEKEKGSKMEN
jgi:hypothetical protein